MAKAAKDNKSIIQIQNPETGTYLKVDTAAGKVIGQKKTKGPYKNIPILKSDTPAQAESKPGRNSKYESHIKPNFECIVGWLRSGHTEGSIAKRLGVSHDSWCVYKNQYSEFSEVIKKGQQFSVPLVVNKLFDRAMGYDFEEVHKEVNQTSRGNKTVIKKVTKHIPPDVGAMAIILFNRDPENWKNKQNIEHTTPDGTGVLMIPGGVSKEAWAEIAKNQQQNQGNG